MELLRRILPLPKHQGTGVADYDPKDDSYVREMNQRISRSQALVELHNMHAELEARSRIERGNPISDAAFPPRARDTIS